MPSTPLRATASEILASLLPLEYHQYVPLTSSTNLGRAPTLAALHWPPARQLCSPFSIATATVRANFGTSELLQRGRQPIHLSLAMTNILSPARALPLPQLPPAIPPFSSVALGTSRSLSIQPMACLCRPLPPSPSPHNPLSIHTSGDTSPTAIGIFQ